MNAAPQIRFVRIRTICIAYFANHFDACPLSHNVRNTRIFPIFYGQPLSRLARGLDEYSGPTPLDSDPADKEWIYIDSGKHGHDVDAAD